MIPITSIFRTEKGLMPGYGIVPPAPGMYDLNNPLIILSEDTVVPIKRAEVYTTSGIVVTTRQGALCVEDDLYHGQPIHAIKHGKLNLYEPPRKIEDKIVSMYAFYAGVALSGEYWATLNKKVVSYKFQEIRSTGVSKKEYFQCRRYIMDFTQLTTDQIYGWLGELLQIMWRFGKIKAPLDTLKLSLLLKRSWWRDMLLCIFHHLGISFSLAVDEVDPRFYNVQISRGVFHDLLSRLLEAKYDFAFKDLDFMHEALPSYVTLLDKDGNIDIIEARTAIPDGTVRWTLNKKLGAYKGLFINFPDLQEIPEANCFKFEEEDSC